MSKQHPSLRLPVHPVPVPPPSNALSSTSSSARASRAVVEGDSFHRYERGEMKVKMTEEGLSHFGPEANRFDKLEELFKTYGETGAGEKRYYLHNQDEASEHNARLGTDKKSGEFTPWEPIPEGTDLLFYEGCTALR